LALIPGWFRREVALLWRYVDGLWKDWQSILGSLGVIAVAAAARLAMEPLIPYLRVHYPAIVPWLSGRRLWLMDGVLFVVLLQYLAWRRLNLQNLSVCLAERGRRLLLVVSNDGPTATVSGSISVEGDTLNPPTNAVAVWGGREFSEEMKIRKGDRKEIILAERRGYAAHGERHFHWSVPFFQEGKPTWTQATEGAFTTKHPRGDQFIPYVQEIRQRVTIRVLSDQPPVECAFTLVGSDILKDLVGVSLCRQSDAGAKTSGNDSVAAYEQWADFELEIVEVAGQFYSLAATAAPSPGDLRGFRGRVQEAIEKAQGLPESYKYDALSLLQPFVDGELSALDIHAANLQEWQVKMRRHFRSSRWSSEKLSGGPPSPTASA
jgi:hypothetical protein